MFLQERTTWALLEPRERRSPWLLRSGEDHRRLTHHSGSAWAPIRDEPGKWGQKEGALVGQVYTGHLSGRGRGGGCRKGQEQCGKGWYEGWTSSHLLVIFPPAVRTGLAGAPPFSHLTAASLGTHATEILDIHRVISQLLPRNFWNTVGKPNGYFTSLSWQGKKKKRRTVLRIGWMSCPHADLVQNVKPMFM